MTSGVLHVDIYVLGVIVVCYFNTFLALLSVEKATLRVNTFVIPSITF